MAHEPLQEIQVDIADFTRSVKENKGYRYFKQHVEESGCGGEARLANDPVAMNHPLEEANVEAGTGTCIGSDTGM